MAVAEVSLAKVACAQVATVEVAFAHVACAQVAVTEEVCAEVTSNKMLGDGPFWSLLSRVGYSSW